MLQRARNPGIDARSRARCEFAAQLSSVRNGATFPAMGKQYILSLVSVVAVFAGLAVCSTDNHGSSDAATNGGKGGGTGAVGAGGGGSTGGGGQGGGKACVPVGQPCSSSDRCCAPAVICAGTCMTGVSDRNLKRDFTPVNRDEILEALEGLPLSTWSYTTEDSGARHIGPMAQDFMATFHVGSSDKLIYQVDADGVAFAAIQALGRRVDRLTKENAGLQRDLARLRSEMARNRRRPTIPR